MENKKKTKAELIKEKAAYCEKHNFIYDANDPGFLDDTHFIRVCNAYEKKGGTR